MGHHLAVSRLSHLLFEDLGNSTKRIMNGLFQLPQYLWWIGKFLQSFLTSICQSPALASCWFWFLSLALLGKFLGAIIVGPLIERYGHRTMMGVTCVCQIVGVISKSHFWCYFSSDQHWLSSSSDNECNPCAVYCRPYRNLPCSGVGWERKLSEHAKVLPLVMLTFSRLFPFTSLRSALHPFVASVLGQFNYFWLSGLSLPEL